MYFTSKPGLVSPIRDSPLAAHSIKPFTNEDGSVNFTLGNRLQLIQLPWRLPNTVYRVSVVGTEFRAIPVKTPAAAATTDYGPQGALTDGASVAWDGSVTRNANPIYCS